MDIIVLHPDRPDIVSSSFKHEIIYPIKLEDLKHVYIRTESEPGACDDRALCIITPYVIAAAKNFYVDMAIYNDRTHFLLFGKLKPPNNLFLLEEMPHLEQSLTLWDIVDWIGKIDVLKQDSLSRLSERSSIHKRYEFKSKPIYFSKNTKVIVNVKFFIDADNKKNVTFYQPEILYNINNWSYTILMTIEPFSSRFVNMILNKKSVKLLLENIGIEPDYTITIKN